LHRQNFFSTLRGMSKGSRKSGRKTPAAPPARAATDVGTGDALPPGAGGAAATAGAGASWFDSADPRRRMLGKIVLAGVWLYVAALWLLALDQSFNWGIFGPKLPPMP
jgi:hypothetical protein